MGGWAGWYNTGKLCPGSDLSPLCWQHKFLSRIPIWTAHYSYKSGGHKQCIGPTCECKINMVPGLDTESHPRTLLYQIETCRDWLNISAIILLTLSPSLSLSLLSQRSQFSVWNLPVFLGLKQQTPTNEWLTSFPLNVRTMMWARR